MRAVGLFVLVGAALAACGTDAKNGGSNADAVHGQSDANVPGSGGMHNGGSGGRVSSGGAAGTRANGAGGASASDGGRRGADAGTGGAPASRDAGGDTDAAMSNASGRWVSGYYVGYQRDLYPPEDIDWNGLTHLIVGVVTPNGLGRRRLRQ